MPNESLSCFYNILLIYSIWYIIRIFKQLSAFFLRKCVSINNSTLIIVIEIHIEVINLRNLTPIFEFTHKSVHLDVISK